MATNFSRSDMTVSDMASHHVADIDLQPATVVWEATRASRGRGADCPPNGDGARGSDELSTDEALAMIDRLEPFAGATLGITGGDPLERDDLELLVTRARTRGLRVVLALSATSRVTVHRLRRLFTMAGAAAVAVRLDGADPDTHDAERRAPGSYRRTLDNIQSARNVGIPVRITTTISRANVGQLDEIAQVVAETGADQWSVGFLVAYGAEDEARAPGAAEQESVLTRLAGMWGAVPFEISAAKSPMFARVMAQQHPHLQDAIAPATDGRGFMFISASGDIRPSRLLPVVGNVREASPVDVYRDAPLFCALRDATRLRGRCGRCEFRESCGGSRSRAYVLTGDPFAEDPTCPWEPAVGITG